MGRKPLEDLGIDGRITLKCIWLRIGFNGRLL
jgi:hypothetical protein